jgi:hypothetical protein
MYPASANFKAALTQDHIVVSKVEIWNSGQYLTTISVDGGQVEVSSESAIRRTCQIALTTERAVTNLVPDTDFDYLTPFGNEMRLFRGIQFDDGTIEYIPLGVFVITEVTISDTNEGVSINVAGEDRSILVSRAKWTQPYKVTSGSLESAITSLLRNRYADVLTNFPTTNVTINDVILGADNSNDPWKDAVYLCELVGYDLFFDVEGTATMSQFPSLEGTTVSAIYVEGSDTSVLSLDRSISTKETYNGIIYVVEGSKVSTPIRIEVWDEDTTSPTYRYGPFGQVPTFINTSVVATSEDAVKAAQLLLEKYRGAQEQITWNSLVDPTLDVDDVIYIKTVGAKVDRTVIIDSVTIPLGPTEQLSAQARVVRVVSTDATIEIGQ